MRPARRTSPPVLLLSAVVLVAALGSPAGATPAAAPFTEPPGAAAAAPQATAEPHQLPPLTVDTATAAQRVLALRDHGGRPFAIVDKRGAQIALFGADGRLLGAAPALLGLAAGDAAAPGLGTLDPADIPPGERTTPAGRFASEPGRNLAGEDVVWFDYDAGLALHRLRPGLSAAQREQRLASADPQDNRVSLGCVVVSPGFYASHVQPLLGRQPGVVYVLPEAQPTQAWLERLGGRAVAARTASGVASPAR